MNKMSIVSAMNGVVKVVAKKHPNGNAVQWGYDSVPDYAFAPQLPTINQFRKIRVPSGNPRPPPKGCDVPVKFSQEGDQYARTETELFEGEKLKPAKQTPSNFRELIENMVATEQTITRDVPFDYNAGIKPGPRGIKFDQIVEPTGQAFRP
jgi:hypothetical protein